MTEQQAFEKELKRRMRSNRYIMEAGIRPVLENGKDDPEYLDRCMALLKQKADAEIQFSAKRVFLATALSQNGRLDAIIVFLAFCRLVWRVSSIYNQRPHPSEMISLYWAVASTTFLAFSLEELDIATEITVGFGEALHAIVPAGFTASIPFAGNALQIFTSSTIDGTANCYLALRAGIITRNAYSYAWRQEVKPSRADVFKEAGGQLMDMSQELVGKVAATVASNLTSAAKNVFVSAGDRTVKTGKDLVEGISKVGHGLSDSAEKLASGTVRGVSKVTTGTVDAADKLSSGIVDTAAKISTGAEKVISGTVLAAGATRDGILSARELTRSTLRSFKEGISIKKRIGGEQDQEKLNSENSNTKNPAEKSMGVGDAKDSRGTLRRLLTRSKSGS